MQGPCDNGHSLRPSVGQPISFPLPQRHWRPPVNRAVPPFFSATRTVHQSSLICSTAYREKNLSKTSFLKSIRAFLMGVLNSLQLFEEKPCQSSSSALSFERERSGLETAL